MESVILRSTETTLSGHKIGVLTLNKPQALNALDLEMATQLQHALDEWNDDAAVVAVVLNGSGEKAFCAGGDVVTMYNAMADSPGKTPQFLQDFFTCEYRLDFTIHTYAKPIICWGAGIVMGGGMGLLSGASHRVVTPSTRMAMPEITIGLYPDVGGSYFLPRLAGNNGLFLGLTGASINGADACYLGMADYYSEASCAHLVDALLQADWTQHAAKDAVDSVCKQVAVDVMPLSVVEQHQATINTLCSGDSIGQIAEQLSAFSTDDKWLGRALSTFAAGSPITAHLVFQQCQRGADLSLAECFRMELDMSLRCGELGEFQEGVRALLIDKDRQPNWQYKHVNDVPVELIERFFTSHWSQQDHPLAGLGDN